MLNISEELKNILRNDRFPLTDTITPKDLEITFDGIATPIHADQMVEDSFSLTESIISDNDIRFGTCRASQIKFKLANVPEDLKGKEFTIDQLIGATDVIPLGKYKVDSAKLQDDLIFKEVIAYDKLKDTDVDVSAWYNGLFPNGDETYTLKQFRSSLLAHLGIEEVDQTLPNDNMIVTKTIEPSQISGRTVLEATVELNGAFGHINRQGKFTRIVLQPSYGLYPSETLYPSEDLYPVAETDTSYTQEDIVADTVSKAMYQSVRFEEYTVKEIDKLQIRAEENDIGAIVGAGTNAYVIEGNFLVFGKSAEELEQIAINAFGNMAKRPYRLYEAQSIGLSYVEVGDALQFATDDSVVGYVLQRTLTGIQALRDEFEAPGSEEREQNFGVNKEIIQLQGKATRIQKDVDGVRVEVEDLEQDTASKFEQTATQIFTEVSRATGAEGELDSKITQTAEAVSIEVTRATGAEGALDSKITQTAESITQEVTRSTQAEGALDSKITQTAEAVSIEVTRATGAEGALDSKITQTAESITQEVTRSTQAEGALDSKITQTAESITQEVTRSTQAEGELDSKITQTAEQISTEVTRATEAEGTISSSLTLLAGEVELKVDASGVISSINLSPEEATIQAKKINFNGFATFDVDGKLTTIDGSVLKTGTVVADSLSVTATIDVGTDAMIGNGLYLGTQTDYTNPKGIHFTNNSEIVSTSNRLSIYSSNGMDIYSNNGNLNIGVRTNSGFDTVISGSGGIEITTYYSLATGNIKVSTRPGAFASISFNIGTIEVMKISSTGVDFKNFAPTNLKVPYIQDKNDSANSLEFRTLSGKLQYKKSNSSTWIDII